MSAPFHTIRDSNDAYSLTILNGDVVESVSLISGGAPARYGDRTGAVLDVQTREGNRDEFSGRASLGASGVYGTLEGPIGGARKSSWLVSARKSYLDYVLDRLNTDSGTDDRVLRRHHAPGPSPDARPDPRPDLRPRPVQVEEPGRRRARAGERAGRIRSRRPAMAARHGRLAHLSPGLRDARDRPQPRRERRGDLRLGVEPGRLADGSRAWTGGAPARRGPRSTAGWTSAPPPAISTDAPTWSPRTTTRRAGNGAATCRTRCTAGQPSQPDPRRPLRPLGRDGREPRVSARGRVLRDRPAHADDRGLRRLRAVPGLRPALRPPRQPGPRGRALAPLRSRPGAARRHPHPPAPRRLPPGREWAPLRARCGVAGGERTHRHSPARRAPRQRRERPLARRRAAPPAPQRERAVGLDRLHLRHRPPPRRGDGHLLRLRLRPAPHRDRLREHAPEPDPEREPQISLRERIPRARLLSLAGAGRSTSCPTSATRCARTATGGSTCARTRPGSSAAGS